jgi:hypothetical protein
VRLIAAVTGKAADGEELMKNEKRLLLSEAATSRHCGVPVVTIRKYRAAGFLTPTLDIPGVITQYDAAAVKAYFDGNADYQRFKARAAGGKRVAAAA